MTRAGIKIITEWLEERICYKNPKCPAVYMSVYVSICQNQLGKPSREKSNFLFFYLK